MLFNLYFSKKPKTKEPHDANYGYMWSLIISINSHIYIHVNR